MATTAIQAPPEAAPTTAIRTATAIATITATATQAAITQADPAATDRLAAEASAAEEAAAAVAAAVVAGNNLNIDRHEKGIFLRGFHGHSFYGRRSRCDRWVPLFTTRYERHSPIYGYGWCVRSSWRGFEFDFN